MAMTERELARAEARMAALRRTGHAVAARYEESAGRVVVTLNTDVEISFPARSAQGLADASSEDLSEIEISPSGLGLHWPRLDADLYVPRLLAGQFGSRRWMAQTLGAAGGGARTEAKAAAARENGKRGGRPVKATAAGKAAATGGVSAVKKRLPAKKALTSEGRVKRARRLVAERETGKPKRRTAG